MPSVGPTPPTSSPVDQWRVTLLLADAAQVVSGKLYLLGGGWSICSAPTPPMAVAGKVDVPWDETNRPHTLKLELLTQDGVSVSVPTPVGNRPIAIDATFEVGRAAGLPPGTPMDFPFAINMGPLPLDPGERYMWRLTIDDISEATWRLAFSTFRPLRTPAGDGGTQG